MRKHFWKKVKSHLLWRVKKTGILNRLSDETYLKFIYFYRFGKRLNLDNPQTFNEKLQWLKLHDRKSEYTQMVDKYDAKKYVASIIGDSYIVPNYGVWDKFEDIDFDSLPKQFVLKTTHDSGGVVICRNKDALDIKAAEKKLNDSLKNNYYLSGREWPYKNVKPRILAEKYMTDDNGSITDYKFYCFNGKAKYLYVSTGLENHKTASISFLNMNWEFAPFGRSDYKRHETLPKMPSKFEEMKKIAEEISSDFRFLRVDLYQIEDKIYFSELTFFPCSGFMPFKPAEWDKELGNLLQL